MLDKESLMKDLVEATRAISRAIDDVSEGIDGSDDAETKGILSEERGILSAAFMLVDSVVLWVKDG